MHLFVTMAHTTLLGVLLALSPRVLFARHTVEAARWGLTGGSGIRPFHSVNLFQYFRFFQIRNLRPHEPQFTRR